MNRRAFGRVALGALGAVGAAGPGAFRLEAVGRSGGRGRRLQDAPTVDGERLLSRMEALEAFGRTPEGGIHRVAYSEANLQAREFVRGIMTEAGLEVGLDPVGNLVGRRRGTEGGLPPLWMGSHIDSVPQGGNYDGQVGSMAAVEVAHALDEQGIRTRHPLEVVIFQNEEGGKTGSRALVGEVEPEELEIVTASGKTIGEGIRLLGGDPGLLDSPLLERGDLAAFLELHVEQGAVLERRGLDVGVVQGIVGIKRWNVTVSGFANHAGTTPMDQRRDALVAAARFVDAVHETARGMEGSQVATVGRIRAEPGAPNVIPGRVTLTLEIRDLEMEKVDRVFRAMEERAGTIGEATRTGFEFERFYLSRAAPTDPRLRDVVEAAADGLGLSTLRMPSGAGHDAQSIALVAPVGMIFVPSVDGISHSPRERTRPEDVVNGANVLLRALLAADGQDWA